MPLRLARGLGGAVLFVSLLLLSFSVLAFDDLSFQGHWVWWVWPLLLLVVCFFIGLVAVPAGVGGGVLFVPIIGGFFPFHLDFVRGTGLLVALTSALVSSPGLLRLGFAELRLALPLALVVSVSSIAGAFCGLLLPEKIAQISLGILILVIVLLMLLIQPTKLDPTQQGDPWVRALKISGFYCDPYSGQDVHWTPYHLRGALGVFVLIGFLAGMFGLGAGWANVPALNLLMQVPMKAAAGTSGLILSMSSSAAWVYLNKGAVLALIAVPAILGMTLGASIGVRILGRLNAKWIRYFVISILFLAGLRMLIQGLR